MRRLAVLLPLILAGCVQPAAPPPVVDPGPPVVAAPPPAPPVPADWRDRPLTPGTWAYTPGKDGSYAGFGPDAAAPLFVVQCAVADRSVSLRVPAPAAGAQAVLTTSYGRVGYPTGAVLGGTGWVLAARDPALDRLAFSRGRFMVEGLGTALILPAWAEVARVVEDCRG